MVRYRPTTFAAVAALAAWQLGCAATGPHKSASAHVGGAADRVSAAYKAAVAPAAPAHAPANEFACAWQNRLAQLPDPTKQGSLVAGLVGQVFLFTDKLQPAEVTGDLTVVVTDHTARPEGQPAATPNVWHVTQDKLKLMTAHDERFGRSVVLFLPWPEEWRDVNRLQIQARYDQPGSETKYAMPTTVTLDFTTPGGGQSAVVPGVSGGSSPLPDPAALLSEARARRAAGRPGEIVQAGASRKASAPNAAEFLPPPNTTTPAGSGREFQRVVIPRR